LIDDIIAFVQTPEEIVNLMISLISEDKKKSISILDSGCGKGMFLKGLLKANFTNIDGIELSKELYSYCQNNFPEVKLYNDDYLDWMSLKEYDLIIGNPPYTHYNSLPKSVRSKVVKIVGNKESDIYYAFILKSIDLLKEDGELIYIVPYSFFFNTFAKVIRDKIVNNGTLDIIIDLDETRLFEGENPETLIFKFTKRTDDSQQRIRILRIKSRKTKHGTIYKKALEALTTKAENDIFTYYERDMFKLEKEIWTTYPEKPITDFTLLKEICWIGVGLVSGYEQAFVVSEEEIMELNEEEKHFLIKAIKSKHCIGFWTEGYENYLLIDKRIMTEKELKTLPRIYKKLLSFKDSMTVRYFPASNKWFHWQALRNYEKLKSLLSLPKIFVPSLDRSIKNRFSLTSEPYLPSGDVLTIIPQKKDPFFILGYLNSKFFREYYLSEGGRRGHRISYTQRIMSNVKIPNFDQKTETNISKIAQSIFENKDDSRRKEIDEIIAASLG
jgi:adenine-specific DNA-methyltransferase